jgi:hypothetical protein
MMSLTRRVTWLAFSATMARLSRWRSLIPHVFFEQQLDVALHESMGACSSWLTFCTSSSFSVGLLKLAVRVFQLSSALFQLLVQLRVFDGDGRLRGGNRQQPLVAARESIGHALIDGQCPNDTILRRQGHAQQRAHDRVEEMKPSSASVSGT